MSIPFIQECFCQWIEIGSMVLEKKDFSYFTITCSLGEGCESLIHAVPTCIINSLVQKNIIYIKRILNYLLVFQQNLSAYNCFSQCAELEIVFSLCLRF